MLDVGRVCVKIAGRDAGLTCVIVDVSHGKIEIDGQTRRRKVNPLHVEPLAKTVNIKKGASHADVVKALKALGVECVERKAKKAGAKPTKVRGKKEAKAPKKEAKVAKTEPKAAKPEVKAAPKEQPKAKEPAKASAPKAAPKAKK